MLQKNAPTIKPDLVKWAGFWLYLPAIEALACCSCQKIFTTISRTLLLMNCILVSDESHFSGIPAKQYKICQHSTLAKLTISRYWLSANRMISASLQKQSTLDLQICVHHAELKGQGQQRPLTWKTCTYRTSLSLKNETSRNEVGTVRTEPIQ